MIRLLYLVHLVLLDDALFLCAADNLLDHLLLNDTLHLYHSPLHLGGLASDLLLLVLLLQPDLFDFLPVLDLQLVDGLLVPLRLRARLVLFTSEHYDLVIGFF
jgi:hypothetical protein